MHRMAPVFAVMVFSSAVAAPAPALAPAGVEENAAKLRAIYDREWEWHLSDSPMFATEVGDARFNDRLDDVSPEAIERRKAHARALQAELKTFSGLALSPEEQLNFRLFRRDVEEEIEGQRFPSELLTLDQFSGPQEVLTELLEAQPKVNRQDVENYLRRLEAVPRYIDQTIVLARKGVATHVVSPQPVLQYVDLALKKNVVSDPTKAPLYGFFETLPPSITAREAVVLRARAAGVIRAQVTPAFVRLQHFFQTEYLPHARSKVGWSELPNGAAWYAYLARVHTTTSKSPEEIHAIGLAEVRRIRVEMEKVKAETGFQGNLTEFFHRLRTEPRFYFSDAPSLLAAYRDIAKRIDPQLVTQFRHLPRLPYGVSEIPPSSAEGMPAAYYQRGSVAAGRAGVFYANTSKLSSRPKWEMESLTLHEAVPGHHLQLAVAQEQESLPLFRRYAGYTAFIEGWGLYSESLGADLGLYTDPYSHFGQLSNEMWRAVRLVVDTGMHAKHWSRQQAIDFFQENAGSAPSEIAVEVDRYISWGGQALAYKMGELKIRSLRHRAEEKLGKRFDVRAFHDFVLAEGGLPLDVLEERVDQFIGQFNPSEKPGL